VLVIGYVRVSSVEQEEGFGPEIQEAAIRDYCRGKSLPDPEIVCESKSGESLLSRHEIKLILVRAEEAREQGIEAHIIFYKLDRLAREVTDQESVVARALSRGFRLHSTMNAEADTLNPAYAGDAMRVAIRQFFGIVNQLERATIQMRLDGGLHAKAKTGGSTGGRLPTGYMAVNKQIVIDPVEAEAVARVFALDATGIDLVGICVIVAREFPAVCGHWKKGFVSRLLKRRKLYQHGLYRTRLGVEEKPCPELIIFHPERPQQAPRPTGRIPWDELPEEIPMMMATLLLHETEGWVKRYVEAHGVTVTWKKGRMLLPKSAVVLMAEGKGS
jgi:DNA invertase Pin-like site-specific DNA recombinase